MHRFQIYFVDQYIGVDAWTRDKLLKRCPSYVSAIFPKEPVVSVIDGTYLYYKNSSNYAIQKRTYSAHKHRNLLKKHCFVDCDGTFFNIRALFR